MSETNFAGLPPDGICPCGDPGHTHRIGSHQPAPTPDDGLRATVAQAIGEVEPPDDLDVRLSPRAAWIKGALAIRDLVDAALAAHPAPTPVAGEVKL